MAAHEENAPVDKEAELRSRVHTKEYSNKLILPGEVLPDPFSLKSNWLSETKEAGLSRWPSVYFMDIEKYLNIVNTSADLMCRLRCEYKEGKAYRYF